MTNITCAQINTARAELARRRRSRRGGVPQAQARLNWLITKALAEHFAPPRPWWQRVWFILTRRAT